MKKPNRIAEYGDIAPRGAQSKAGVANPGSKQSTRTQRARKVAPPKKAAAMKHEKLGPVREVPAKRPTIRNGYIVGWKLIASNEDETLARCSAGFVLRTARRDARGESQWPPYQEMLTARQARAWLRRYVVEIAFPKVPRPRAQSKARLEDLTGGDN